MEAALDALEQLVVARWPDWKPTNARQFNGSALFVGYLLFDAWIGNTDRHHENWAIVQRGSARYLTPSYDHASSLGREESLEKIGLRLRGSDPRCTVESYAARAHSAFYSPCSTQTIHPLEAFLRAERLYIHAGAYWRHKLDSIGTEEIEFLIQKIPETLWSKSHGRFVMNLLEINRQRIRAAHVE